MKLKKRRQKNTKHKSVRLVSWLTMLKTRQSANEVATQTNLLLPCAYWLYGYRSHRTQDAVRQTAVADVVEPLGRSQRVERRVDGDDGRGTDRGGVERRMIVVQQGSAAETPQAVQQLAMADTQDDPAQLDKRRAEATR